MEPEEMYAAEESPTTDPPSAPAPDGGPVVDSSQHRWRSALQWMVRPPCFGGLVGAVVFFALAMTPSLIPRSWGVQGFLAGLTAAIGYGVGSAASAIVRRFVRREPSRRAKHRAWISLAVGGPTLLVASVWAGASWDGELRKLMEMPLETPWDWVGVVLVGLLAAVVFVVIARVVRGLGHLLVLLTDRLLPRTVSVVVGGLVVAAFLVFVVLGGLSESLFRSIDATAKIADRQIGDDIERPTSSLRSGSAESLIAWEDLGSKGREFTGKGPTVDELSAFTGRQAMEPIRIYAGLDAANSLDERIDLVMQELDRTGAFERSVVIVQTPSGNGEVGAVNVTAPEYMFAGDIAQVAVQYGYAGSFATMVTKPGAGNDTAAAIIDAVTDRVAALPEDARPQVFVAGESLGSLATESSFDGLDDLVATVDGALMIGPTLFNEIRNDVIANRDDGSPVWLPVLDDGTVVRFAQDPADLDKPAGDWGDRRVVYLSNASDPVAWFEPSIAWRPPEFLDDPRGPDVSPDMVWIPAVTFWQTLTDLPFASGAPLGHGHRYKLNIVDGWAAVLQPGGWTADDTQRLRDELDES